MMENCRWLQGRLVQLLQCVRDQTEQIENIPPPPLHILFLYFVILLFCYFFLIFFAMFCVDMAHFFNFFFYAYKFWDSRYRKKKEKEEFSHRPATRIFVRKYRHSVDLFWFKITFSCGLPTWRLIPDQFEWCIAAAGMCALVVCVIVNIVMYPAVM